MCVTHSMNDVSYYINISHIHIYVVHCKHNKKNGYLGMQGDVR